MSGESFRFIHAGDFHLETPLSDLDTLPPSLKEAIVSAPRTAAAAVFEAALAENIDFLVLTGDLLSPAAAGPHGMSLLIDGFEKLAARNKPVFYVTGIADDSAKWPDTIPLPPNVHLFSKTAAELVPVVRSGRTICMVAGRSSDGRSVLHVPSYQVEPTDEFIIAAGYGNTDAGNLKNTRFDHWSLGGKWTPAEIDLDNDMTASYCGTTQARRTSHTGGHGYTVIDVDADRTKRIHRVDCDTFRYCDETVPASQIASAGNLKNLLGVRIGRLQQEAAGRHLLIRWNITISDGDQLSLVGDLESTVRELRRDHGAGNPTAWTLSAQVQGPAHYPQSWRDEDTILGDFLRAAAHIRSNGGSIDLAALTEEQTMPETMASLLAEVSPSRSEHVSQAATMLGVDLLRGGKITSA